MGQKMFIQQGLYLNQLSRCRYEAELKANEEKAKSDVKDKEIQNRNEIQEIESQIREPEKGN